MVHTYLDWADKKDWGYDPFELVKKEGRFYGRGVADNKGQLMIHLVSVFALIKEKRLGFNVKFLIEGNEETGMVKELMEVVEANKDKVRSDYVLISDGEMVGDKPTIEASFRGGFMRD